MSQPPTSDTPIVRRSARLAGQEPALPNPNPPSPPPDSISSEEPNLLDELFNPDTPSAFENLSEGDLEDNLEDNLSVKSAMTSPQNTSSQTGEHGHEQIDNPPGPSGAGGADEGDHDDIEPTWQEVVKALADLTTKQPKVNTSRTKAREPEPFSGTNPDDLSRFLFQCRLYFRANPSQFSEDSTKVNFALTFLTDIALRWFETGIDQEETLGIISPWLSNWEDFVKELKTHFGHADFKGEAAELLESLRMKPGEKITNYNVEFMRLAGHLNWSDDVLLHRYYKGLPDRLQDKIVESPFGRPTTFTNMRELSITLDNRYWERQRE